MDIWPIVSIGIIVTIVLIGIIVIWIIVKERRSGFPSKDERVHRINGRAAYYSLLIGLYFMLALVWVQLAVKEFLGYYLLDAGYALIASLLVESISMLVLRWHFGRKGE